MARVTAKPLVVTLNWARVSLRETVDGYRSERPEQFMRLVEQIGESFDADRIRSLIQTPPAWLDAANADDWRVIAEIAEARGLWEPAADASLAAAEVAVGNYAKAGTLAAAAAACGVGGDLEKRDALLEQARHIFPRHPKVLVIGTDEDARPAEQLKALEHAVEGEPRDRALVAGQRTLAYLRLADMANAHRHLADARSALPDSLLVRSLAVCVEVQQARLDVIDSRPLRTVALTDAAAEAEQLRRVYSKECRFGEAARMLMLAADAYAVLWRHNRAERTLRSATPDERAAEGSPEVLGFSALRAMRFRVALELTEGAPKSDSVALIRASALREVGTPAQREHALADLDRLVSSDGSDRVHAAYARLATTIDSDAPWSDEAEAALIEGGYERQALIAKAYRACWRGARLDQAREVLGEHVGERWAKTLLFRCSLLQRNRASIKSAAQEILTAGPSQVVRVDAGRALAQCRDFDHAYEVLIQPAQDPNTPVRSRADAYAALVSIAGREWNDWKLAGELFDEWLALEGHDERALPWAPIVYRRRHAPLAGTR